ncbi:MAG: helix-turn-helix domain-containing protein [Anaerolineae bacterium]|nr:MAG: helix-turn-helix domain-containing protein [Anaerolineae bacterium]
MPHTKKEWMSLKEVAELLGVHPSTVRNWSNRGELPVHRTQGGHRRYRRDEIHLWLRTHQQDDNPNAVVSSLYHAMRNIRFRISEGQLSNEAWYQRLDEHARMQYRMSGRNLLQGLIAALNTSSEQASAEARALGYEYASRAHSNRLSITEAVCAFLFFRNALFETLMDAYQAASVNASSTWRVTMQKVNAFTDEVLVSLLETFHAYENHA